MKSVEKLENLISEAKKGGDDEGRALWAKVKGDLAKGRQDTRKFVRKVERLEERADNIRKAVAEMVKEQKSGGLDNVRSAPKLVKAVSDFDKDLKDLYGIYKMGKTAIWQVAGQAGISTKKVGSKKPRAKSIAAHEMSRGSMMKDLNRYSRDLNKRIRDCMEYGSRALRVMDRMSKRKSDWTEQALKDELSGMVRDYVDFNAQVSGVFYGAVRGIAKRANEIASRASSKNFSNKRLARLVSDHHAYISDEYSYLFEDEDMGDLAEALHLDDDDGEFWVDFMNEMFDGAAEELVERGDVPENPVERARKRMDDAAKRGGVSGLVKAVERRIKATKDKAKLMGIGDMLDVLIKQLDSHKSDAFAKAKKAK